MKDKRALAGVASASGHSFVCSSEIWWLVNLISGTHKLIQWGGSCISPAGMSQRRLLLKSVIKLGPGAQWQWWDFCSSCYCAYWIGASEKSYSFCRYNTLLWDPHSLSGISPGYWSPSHKLFQFTATSYGPSQAYGAEVELSLEIPHMDPDPLSAQSLWTNFLRDEVNFLFFKLLTFIFIEVKFI